MMKLNFKIALKTGHYTFIWGQIDQFQLIQVKF